MALKSSDLASDAMIEAGNGQILKVTSMDPLSINDAKVITADIVADNGVIHILDTVLLPPSQALLVDESTNNTNETTSTPTLVPAETSAPTTQAAGPNILEVAAATPGLSTFLNLLQQSTGPWLDGDGPFTVFAPNNGAFGNLPGKLKEALNDPEQQLAVMDILLSHVVSDTLLLSMDLALGATVVAANDETLEVTSLNPPMINGVATVVVTDILAENGVIHVIDTVLLPPAPTAPPGTSIPEVLATTPGLSTFLSLLEMTNVFLTLSDDGGPFTVFAPNNGAFFKLPADNKVTAKDPINIIELTELLLDHGMSSPIYNAALQ